MSCEARLSKNLMNNIQSCLYLSIDNLTLSFINFWTLFKYVRVHLFVSYTIKNKDLMATNQFLTDD